MLSFLQRPLSSWTSNGGAGSSGGGGGLRADGSTHDLRRPPGRRKESLFEKLKKVASQPALAVTAAPVSITQAAEAVISSARSVAAPKGGELSSGASR